MQRLTALNTIGVLSLLLHCVPVFAQIEQLPSLATGTTDKQHANLAVTATADPAGHGCCVLAPPNLLRVFLLEGELAFDQALLENPVPWFDFGSMPIDSNNEFSGESLSTVAGFSEIRSVITGQIQGSAISAVVRVGVDGGLPTGQSIDYSISITPQLGTEWFIAELGVPNLALQAAVGLGLQLVVQERAVEPESPVNLALSLDANGSNAEADWWLVLVNGDEISSFDLATGQFVPGLVPTYQGPLQDIPSPVQVLQNFPQPSNDFTIVWGVDTNRNGLVDTELLGATGFHFYF